MQKKNLERRLSEGFIKDAILKPDQLIITPKRNEGRLALTEEIKK